MDSILGKLGKGIQGILGNPAVQGVLAAAATGNPAAAGLAFAPIIKNSRDRNKLENDRNRVDLEREQLALGRDKRRDEAVRRLPSLLGPIPEVQSIGDGDQVVPLPPDLGARRERDLLGVLGELNPEAVASGVLGEVFPGQERAEPSDVRILRAAGIDPQSAEGRAFLLRDQQQDSSSDQLQDILTRLTIDEKLDRRDAERGEKQNQAQKAETAVLDTLDTIERFSAANDRLADTPLATGSTGLDLRRSVIGTIADVAGLANNDELAGELGGSVEALDTLRKESSVLAGNILKSFEAQGITPTRSLQRLIEQSSASDKVSTGTNNSVLRVALKEQLREADRSGIDLSSSQRKKFDELAAKLKGQRLDFNDIREAQLALSAKAFEPGDKIFINGRAATIEDVE